MSYEIQRKKRVWLDPWEWHIKDDVVDFSAYEDNLEKVVENWTHMNPVHHSFDVCRITDTDKTHAMGKY